MTAPFSYTHPSHIAAGYRARPSDVEYSKKHYVTPEDYPLHHREPCKLPRSNSNCCACVDDLPRRPDPAYHRIPADPHNGARTPLDMVAAYGVYSHSEEETGFETAAQQFYPQQVVVVTSGRDGTTANTLARTPPHSSRTPLLVVLLFVVVFLLVSGFLFYFNIVTYAPESSLQDPCENVHCSHGGLCTVGVEGVPECRCPAECPQSYSPVCGTDGNTYDNMCSLRVFSCTHKRTILVQHPGECESQDPCASKTCPAGATCIPSPDGHTASCLCPKHCPVAPPPLGLGPICGTNNRDYRDQCDMHRHACEQDLSVSVKYEGYCDPCSRLECPPPEVCQLDEDRGAMCQCGEVCESEVDPVCGSDGLTYASECTLRLQACRSKKALRIIYRGTCGSGVNPCTGVKCQFGEECTISKFGIAQCECISQCEPIVKQVCGSDGKTYDSECHLRKTSCFDRKNVSVLYSGVCETPSSCREVSCELGGDCVVVKGEAVCVCPVCTLVYDPLCGSDGHTYHSPCHLRAASCQLLKNIEVVHQGVCNGCETKTCGYFSTCETDKQGLAHCVCVQSCPKEDTPHPVCGTDGITYDSLCELRKYVCETKQSVELDFEGDCELCSEVVCKYGARCKGGVCVCPTECPEGLEEPVCASNMVTYRNECDMQKQSCASDPPVLLTVIFFGACSVKFKTAPLKPTASASSPIPSTARNPCLDIYCEYDATCELGADGFPRCSCLLDCSLDASQPHICGSDYRIYNSSCAMRMEACQRQKEIRLRPLELCKGMEVKPCNGEGAVVNPDTGEQIDCGSGPNRQDCPLDSYCHQTPHFARCCPKEAGVYLKSCQDSWYGCCPDKKTPAQGPDHLGCPSLCGCNKIGSYSEACVGDSEQCQCKPGVGGLKCDRCLPGYWGLPKISSGYQGCLLCDCSLLGSVREDCEQMTGRCVCKPGVQGHKCDTCMDAHLTLTANGCSTEAESRSLSGCETESCYFGAVCEATPDGPQCVCRQSCPEENLQDMVCGDDGKLYASKCQLQLFVCQVQKQIGVQDMKYCNDDNLVLVTELPVKQGTPTDTLYQINLSASRKKFTRHVLLEKNNSKRKKSILRSIFWKETAEFPTSCEAHLCHNGGTCVISHSTGLPTCLCSLGFHGVFCDAQHISPSRKIDKKLADYQATDKHHNYQSYI